MEYRQAEIISSTYIKVIINRREFLWRFFVASRIATGSSFYSFSTPTLIGTI
ncbi:hypothetical protein [Planococcus antarcticus]|uniref:hypothetical protein n=1 Tax=Planococcus antarcticus TaxID=161360 RepID=UPI0012B5AA8A|nr:hypothetical protein [Planococcus antarcticus]